MTHVRAASAGLLAALALVALGSVPAEAADAPPAAGPEQAASAPETLDTLSRFFSRDGALARSAARPRIEGASVPVRVLSPDFVAGKAGAPVARVEFHASKAVASDGQTASLWTVRQAGGWRVVNIATGDDETRYAAQGERTLPGGVVFREPQIDAWYVHKGAKVLPLDEDAVRAVGGDGTSLAAYRERVTRAYGDKLPGSGYARKGAAGGYDAPPPDREEPLVTAASATAGAGAVLALGLVATAAWRRRRTASRQEPAA
ncbi:MULTISPECIES: hypothetical protein [Streptomyces]|uniref:hypothetical protein n=1 Tax=Streptomyces TaxID=1883 RepID=UPI0013173E76|nr:MULTISPECIES: hypothetical protein [Streptomyces]QGZ52829.1 hypothetical protein GPZ77_08290 [Streptomyces sp. QHH-9511]GGT65644.1 hypothetical protein GCM10010272_05180 [Streptomyces lateritius]